MTNLMNEYLEPEEVMSDSPTHYSPNQSSQRVVSGRKYINSQAKTRYNKDDYQREQAALQRAQQEALSIQNTQRS
jgi:hypothetical protein